MKTQYEELTLEVIELQLEKGYAASVVSQDYGWGGDF